MRPINDVTKIDLLAERHDGGIDMGVVAQGPLDASAETLGLVEQKIRNYVREALDPTFREQFGGASISQVRILFESRFATDPAVVGLVKSLATEVAELGLVIEFRRY
jgi:hypothetical protein